MVFIIADIVRMILQLLQGFFFYKCLTYILEPRKQIVIRVVNWLLAATICGMVIYPNDVVNITVLLPIFFFMLLLGFTGNIVVKGSIVLLFFPIIVALNYLLEDVGITLFQILTDESEQINAIFSTSAIFITVLFWFVFMRVLGARQKEIKNILDKKSWLLLDVICLASLAAVMSCVYFTPMESYKVWPCMLACILTNIGSIRLAYYLAGSIRAELERKNLKLKKDYYEELERNQQNLRKFRHDIHNHFIVATGLLKEGSVQEAEGYIEKLSGQFQARGRTFCTNSIINAVVNAKYNKAVSEGIDCFFHIEIDRLLFVDDIDICTIFSNTIDNAIEACMRIEEVVKRSISVKGRCTEQGFFSYEIKNSKQNQICKENGRYKTKKPNKVDHGIGLDNVREAVMRYNGTMDVTYTDETFQVVILIAEASNLS